MYGEGRTHLVHSQPVWIGKLSPRERQGVLRVTQEAQTELGTKLEPPASKTWALLQMGHLETQVWGIRSGVLWVPGEGVCSATDSFGLLPGPLA